MSTKELKTKKKRTKLVWYDNTSNWDKFPLVVLAKELEKQDWFRSKGITCTFFRKYDYNTAKKLFETQSVTPQSLLLIQQYKTTEVWVDVEWIFQETRCSIERYKPRGSKKTKSRYIEGAFERIKETFEEAVPIAETIISAEQEREQRKIEAEEFYKNLCEELGVELKTSYQNEYQYQQGKHFAISFERNKKTDKNGKITNTFDIGTILGTFDIEEIKQLIKIVGGSPRAIASRLTGKKE